jgi:hypothetical protein
MGAPRRPDIRSASPPSPRASGSSTASPSATSIATTAQAIDIKKGHDDYDKLMADVRAYCLAEYERIWGRPWDNTWPEQLRHIQKMRGVASEAHRVWSQLRRTMKEAVDFVASQGLPHHQQADLLGTAGKTVYESIVIHEWLYRHLAAVEDLLCAEEFEKMSSARSMLATILGRTRIKDPAQSATPIIWNSGRLRGRELKEREMAYVSLLVGNEPSKLKDRLKDELLSVEDVIAMEREAINTARHRHDDGKIEARATHTASSPKTRTQKTRKAPKQSGSPKTGARRRP